MKCSSKSMLLYGVTDRAWIGKQSLFQQVEDALKGGLTCLQLREKEMNKDEFLKEALEIKEICNKYKVPFIINDEVDIAVRCKADGIHVGQNDMEVKNVRSIIGDDMILGVSVHTLQQAITAEKLGADYLGVGAIFSTSTKMDARNVSLNTLKEICRVVKIPVVAIGGINKSNIMELAGTGVHGVALVSAIFSAENIERECIELRLLSEEMVQAIL